MKVLLLLCCALLASSSLISEKKQRQLPGPGPLDIIITPVDGFAPCTDPKCSAAVVAAAASASAAVAESQANEAVSASSVAETEYSAADSHAQLTGSAKGTAASNVDAAQAASDSSKVVSIQADATKLQTEQQYHEKEIQTSAANAEKTAREVFKQQSVENSKAADTAAANAKAILTAAAAAVKKAGDDLALATPLNRNSLQEAYNKAAIEHAYRKGISEECDKNKGAANSAKDAAIAGALEVTNRLTLLSSERDALLLDLNAKTADANTKSLTYQALKGEEENAKVRLEQVTVEDEVAKARRDDALSAKTKALESKVKAQEKVTAYKLRADNTAATFNGLPPPSAV